jgi:inner membrane protein involved in colicin E2 resistance
MQATRRDHALMIATFLPIALAGLALSAATRSNVVGIAVFFALAIPAMILWSNWLLRHRP